MNKSFGITFVLALALVIANAIISYRSTITLIENNSAVLRTEEVIEELTETFLNIREAESGQRGYLITSDESYLPSYQNALSRIDENIRRLREMTNDNPLQQERLIKLQEKLETRLDTLDANLELSRTRGLDYIRSSGLFDRGTVQSEDLQAALRELAGEENRLLQIRLEESRVSGRNTILTFIVSNLLLLLLFAAVYYFFKRRLDEQKRSEASLLAANEQLETRVLERTAELDKTNTELQRSNRELQDFAFVASHDLQEPLRKIQAFGDRLRMKFGDRLGDEGVDHLSRMQNAARRMQTLINDLLTFSRVTTKAQPFAATDLDKTAREVLEDLETRIQQTDGRVEIGELPTIDADPLQMRQLLQNIIGNALKFHRPEAAPVVKVKAEILRESDENQENFSSEGVCRLEIEDNGIGFDVKYLDRIFTPFQRLHARHEYEGTGMGLAVCRKITERHGGTITADSTPGAGTKFIITLPVKQENGQNEGETGK